MGLHYRHYKPSKFKSTWYLFGIVLYDKKQPTLDILIGYHVFVFFWSRKNVDK
jgi:hypothetical protein